MTEAEHRAFYEDDLRLAAQAAVHRSRYVGDGPFSTEDAFPTVPANIILGDE